MGSSHSELKEQEVEDLVNKTGFSQEQILNIHKRFKILTHNDDTLRKEDLENISDLASNPIRSQIINAFFDKRNFCRNEVGTVEEINFEEFLTVMSFFRPLKQNLPEEERKRIRKEKLRFLFNMHDKDNDGTITLDEYKRVVEELLSNSPGIEKETVKDIADAAMLEVANVTMGEMAPDEIYAGITFDHFLQYSVPKAFNFSTVPGTVPEITYDSGSKNRPWILKGVEIESQMHIRFLYVDTATMNCTK